MLRLLTNKLDIHCLLVRYYLQWLQVVYQLNDPINVEQKAANTLSVLEGAMMVSKALGDNDFFDQATHKLK